MEERTCVNCGPQSISLWKQVIKRGGPEWRCIKCTRESNKKLYWKNPEKRRAHSLEWGVKNRDRKLAVNAAWRLSHAEERRVYMKKRLQERKNLVLLHYGGKCKCCGESEVKFLCIDHIDGGGNKHRAEVGGGSTFYGWVIKHNFPSGFQVLCHNCNFASGAYGVCPHSNPS
jgi:hypothetical protein